jgi:hypothetical protein
LSVMLELWRGIHKDDISAMVGGWQGEGPEKVAGDQ